MTDKWMPEVGQECEVYDPRHDDWKRVTVTAESNTAMLAKFEDNEYEFALQKTCEFRPINTEADKYRDEQIEKIKSAAFRKVSLYFETEIAVANELYEAGCRILAPDERIVKPLTELDIERLWECRFAGKSVGISEFVQIAMKLQRELKVID